MTTPSLHYRYILVAKNNAVVPLAEYEALQNAVDERCLWMQRSYGKFSKIPIKNLCLSNWSSASTAVNTRCACGASIAA